MLFSIIEQKRHLFFEDRNYDEEVEGSFFISILIPTLESTFLSPELTSICLS
jgi:hypothetical protein